jgi:hypothetical protein
MTKRIKHTSELPDWFKLEKYEFTKDLDVLGWQQQLSVRALCPFFELDPINHREAFSEELWLIFQATRENPNSGLFRDNKLADHIDNAKHFDWLDPRKNTRNLLGIYSISMIDFIALKNLLNTEKVEAAKKSFSPADDEDELYPSWMNLPLYTFFDDDIGEFNDFLSIDLSQTDVFLIENFKKYLENRRKKQKLSYPLRKIFRESDFKNWSKLMILPLLDLLIFGIEQEIQIPNRVLADAIYPSSEKGEETIRKTAHPLAMKLINSRTLIQLSIQAAHEIAEKN